jgi:putative transposase
VILAHQIRLVPTADQEAYFMRAAGVARFAYNWALAEWKRQRDAGEKPSELKLRRQLNAIKRERFPWMCEVTKNAPQQAIKHLGRAYKNFFADVAKYRDGEIPWKRVRVPKPKKKGKDDRFRADNGCEARRPNAVRVNGKMVRLPVIGWVRMREAVRFEGRIAKVTISRQADAWYASFAIDVEYEPDVRTDMTTVGVDLGVASLATISDGASKFPAPKPLRRYLKKLQRLSRYFRKRSCIRVIVPKRKPSWHGSISVLPISALMRCISLRRT